MRYSKDPFWITTLYNSQCAGCEGRVFPGQKCFYYPKGKHLYCPKCADSRSRDFEALAWDEDVYNA